MELHIAYWFQKFCEFLPKTSKIMKIRLCPVLQFKYSDHHKTMEYEDDIIAILSVFDFVSEKII